MGIQGLLPLLKSIQKPTELKKFTGETFAVDAYGWLHRGCIACALELAQGKPTKKYVDFAMHRVRMVKYFGVTPYLVFDGDYLPSKASTEASRAKRREESKKIGNELLRAGKPAQAYQEFQKSIDVTPEMARNLIEELKKANIPYVVAPYEADAQMVYLEREGIVSGIISEDSDLLVFGAKRLLTKLDQHGQCVEINRRDFCAVREISLTGFTDVQFRQMAILSGCDYLEGIKSMGLKSAYRMIRKHKTPERVVRMLQFEGKTRISENYMAAFRQAELTFIHQRVFCPRKQELVLLTEADSTVNVDEMPFIGAKLEPDTARAVAIGDVNPITKEVILLQAPADRRNAGQPPTRAAPSRSLGKPINQYFKDNHRIPLGEMDPNCFKVEPNQIAALTENGLLPRVFPLPRPYIGDGGAPRPASLRPYTTHRRRTEPVSTLRGSSISSSSSNRRKSAEPTGRATQESDVFSRPLKKPRLCEDPLPGSGLNGHESERSKFFPTSRLKTPRSKETDPILMSDDSIEEALLSLPDVESWNSTRTSKSRQSMEVFQDSPIERNQPTQDKSATFKDDDIIPRSDDDPSSMFHEEPASVETVSQTPPRLSLKRFSYSTQPAASTANGVRLMHGLPTPSSSMQKPPPPVSTPPTSSTPFLTPLQRIGAQALGRNRAAADGTPPSTPAPSDSQGAVQKKRRSLGVKGRVSLPANPAFVPLPKVDLEEIEALNRPLGSEDQIIPESEGEADENAEACCHNDENSPPGKRGVSRLDLSRFLHT